MACEQMERKCYSMELDPKYVDVIIKRWEEHTSKKARLCQGSGGQAKKL
jgi:site-specific DNA-methyltransferase (adenine-specific)